jgi:hypothetical protein
MALDLLALAADAAAASEGFPGRSDTTAELKLLLCGSQKDIRAGQQKSGRSSKQASSHWIFLPIRQISTPSKICGRLLHGKLS